MEKRFTKESVSEKIITEIDRLSFEFEFDADKGRAQLLGRTKEDIIAYGRWQGLRDLHEALFGNDKNFYIIP